MSLKRTLLLAVLVSLGLLAACGKKSPDDSKALAKVNSETISERDYETICACAAPSRSRSWTRRRKNRWC